jgi:UDP-GlcNAc:undecaprenyl-phosphate/decaprenyl-phosphate GlcNAc-1-phosphate transferase
MQAIEIFLYSAISFLISVLFFPVIIKLLTKWQILDMPSDHKIHIDFTPSMGGISIILGVVFALLMSLSFEQWILYRYLFIGLGLMFFIGLRDDVLALNPKQKLISQFLPVFIIVFLDGTRLSSSYGAVSQVTFGPWSASIISIMTLVVITNAYNLIDGVDGLAGMVGLICLLFFGAWFFWIGEISISLIAFCFASSLIAFLFFNWQPSRIFMGDTGALMIGILLSYLAIRFINSNYQLPQGSPAKFMGSIATVVCVLIIPVFDTTRIIILRMRKLQSPFRADRNHIHHQFLNIGFTHSQTVLILGGINILFIFLAWVLKEKDDVLILSVVVILCLIINFILKRVLVSVNR